MNRLFHAPSCPCRRARLIRSRVKRFAEAVENAAGGTLEFFLPSRKSFTDDPRRPITFYLLQYEAEVPQGSLASGTAAELRRMAASLLTAADGIEALAKGGAA